LLIQEEDSSEEDLSDEDSNEEDSSERDLSDEDSSEEGLSEEDSSEEDSVKDSATEPLLSTALCPHMSLYQQSGHSTAPLLTGFCMTLNPEPSSQDYAWP
jgi:hypothetical protein